MQSSDFQSCRYQPGLSRYNGFVANWNRDTVFLPTYLGSLPRYLDITMLGAINHPQHISIKKSTSYKSEAASNNIPHHKGVNDHIRTAIL